MAGGSGQHRAATQASWQNQGGRDNQNFGPPGPSRFDGPSDGPGSPRPPTSPSKSQSGGRGVNPFSPGLGYDPAKPPPKIESVISNTRVELPSAAYKLDQTHPSTDLPTRPAINTAGKAIQVRVNQFKIARVPDQDIYQYEVHIGSGTEKRGLVKAVWECNTVRKMLNAVSNGRPWLWNGDKIAWCASRVQEQRLGINMDRERGRPPRPNSVQDEIRFVLRPSNIIRLAVLNSYLGRQHPFDNACLEGINFMDHLIRQWPSEQYTAVKRSFFAQGGQRHPLDNLIEAMRGVYSSIRICELSPSMGGPSTGLALNVDVANGTFWTSQDVHQAARNLCKARNRGLSYQIFRDQLLPVKGDRGIWTWSFDFKELRKMSKLKFRVKHRGKQDDKKDYTIKSFTFSSDGKYSQTGVNAKNYFFDWKQRNGDQVATTNVSVFDYFHKKYNVRLEHWYLPLIETTRDGHFPMELCVINPNQRYLYKLGPDQTASMIKFAVTRPKERLSAISHGVGMLKWNNDPYLNHFGLKVDSNMTITQARLLPPPEVQYAGAKATPGYSGRWDLRGKKFFAVNPQPLKSWGVCVVGECVNDAVTRNFCNVLINTYIGHGGKVENKHPVIHIMGRGDSDLPKGAETTRSKAGNQANCLPQILLFVLPGRDSFMYERLKKNMECRFAMVSQMVNVAHVQKATPQYCSNVCMKLNAKLGGTSCKVADKPGAKPFFQVKTMIIGADVSHPSPGSKQASMAAITMSMDQNACRYAAAVETNGHRVEMISRDNIYGKFMYLFNKWCAKFNGGPSHIYYFRDGVSEGQYAQVLQYEVDVMKAAIREKYGPNAASGIKWTVTICSKRHHIRIFPKDGDSTSGDRNGNALPGTLVERDVTHPFEYDFYLSAHSAIQGTARPVHYHVILDEAQCNVNEFQRLIYNHSYQFMRSTTPVSLFPAVYYAHLASNRARAHESVASSEGARGGQKFEEAQQDAVNLRIRQGTKAGSSQTGTSAPEEALPLLPLGNEVNNSVELIDNLRLGMWYI